MAKIDVGEYFFCMGFMLQEYQHFALNCIYSVSICCMVVILKIDARYPRSHLGNTLEEESISGRKFERFHTPKKI